MVEITYLEFYNSFEPPDQNKGVGSIDQQRFLFQGYVCTIRGKVDTTIQFTNNFIKDGHPGVAVNTAFITIYTYYIQWVSNMQFF